MSDNSVHTNNSNKYNKQIQSLLNGYVFYVETQDNKEVTDYLRSNYKELQALFKTKYKTFIIASSIEVNDDLREVISYYYPRIYLDALYSFAGNNNQYLLELFDYKDEVRSGLLSIDTQTSFTDLSNIKIEVLKSYLTQYVSNIYIPEFDDLPFGYDNSDTNISLDDETQELVNAVISKFNALKENGSFLNVLPIIENYIKENNSNIDDLSPIFIDDEYSIYLTEYNNLEIKLSHLSKCIYLLFLNHSEGIHLKELASHKEELIGYYKSVSNRLDYDKMLVSINDIVNTETNAIYVHLSRIKSIFTKNLHPTIAEHYYIQGGKDKPKKISLNRDLIQWKQLSERPEFDF